MVYTKVLVRSRKWSAALQTFDLASSKLRQADRQREPDVPH